MEGDGSISGVVMNKLWGLWVGIGSVVELGFFLGGTLAINDFGYSELTKVTKHLWKWYNFKHILKASKDFL